MRPSSITTSASAGAAPEPSNTRPPRNSVLVTFTLLAIGDLDCAGIRPVADPTAPSMNEE